MTVGRSEVLRRTGATEVGMELESRDWAALLEHFVILDDRMFPCHGHDVNVVLIYHEPIVRLAGR